MQADWPAENILLALLCERPMHGYELAQTVKTDAALRAIWRIELSEVYFLLRKLLKQGAIVAEAEAPGAGPRRVVYAPTPAGRIALEGWLTTPEKYPRNLRTALLTPRLLKEAGQPERLLIATDTPTGSGIMPLGMFYTISHLASLGGMAPERAIAAATGNNARVYGLNAGILAEGRDADVVLIDACAGGSKDDALSAISNGDVPAVSAVFTAGVPRFVGRSRNTPAGMREVRVAGCRLPMDFSGSAH